MARNRINWDGLIPAACLLTLVAGVGIYAYKTHFSGSGASPVAIEQPVLKPLKTENRSNRKAPQPTRRELSTAQNVILDYLSQPDFASKDFLQQVTGSKANLERFYTDSGELFFSIPHKLYTQDEKALLSRNPDGIQWGRTKSGEFTGPELILDNLRFKSPGDLFFKLDAADLNVDATTRVQTRFNSATYSQSIKELDAFVRNESVYGGNLKFRIGTKKGLPLVAFNQGAFVAKKGEPSLTRLVDTLTESLTTSEEVAQRLLDFVSTEVGYNAKDAKSPLEVLKRPNEVLMAQGDCNNLAGLLSSLYTQKGITHWLAYMHAENHLTVLVQGDYSTGNGHGWKQKGGTFTVAEATFPGFKIGKTRLELDINNIEYIQKPGKDSRIKNLKTGEYAPWF